MSAGFCLHCGLRLTGDYTDADIPSVHAFCFDEWEAGRAAEAKRPKTSMEHQLDRIEGLLMAIRDRYSL